jgi:hypothetical protein
MKPFETRYTEWLEGQMPPSESQAFEAELALPTSPISLSAAQNERAATRSLGTLLRSHVPAPELKNADFFNTQILREITAEHAKQAQPSERKHAPAQRQEESLFSQLLSRYLWAGGSCVAMAVLIFATLVVPNFHPQEAKVDYYAQILDTQTGDPTISAVAFHDDVDNITVLWLDGLDYLPKAPAKRQ